MKNYEPVMSFGEDAAEGYVDFKRGDEVEAVAFLEQRAHGGPALDLAIGTGRIALPLAARGIHVDGIDISTAMVDQLRSKPGGDQLSVTIGDFADVPVPGAYRLGQQRQPFGGGRVVQEIHLFCQRLEETIP